jgi:hypothetical protein
MKIKKTAKEDRSDVLPSIEQQLNEKKPRDVVDTSRNSDNQDTITELSLEKGELSRKNEDDDIDITIELLLEKGGVKRTEDKNDEVYEKKLESEHDSSTWEGNDIKIYRDINARKKKEEKANKEFYKNNKDVFKEKTAQILISKNKKLEDNIDIAISELVKLENEFSKDSKVDKFFIANKIAKIKNFLKSIGE